MTLSAKHAAWLDDRDIDPETARAMGLYSVRPVQGGDPVPDPNGQVLAFPFVEGGREVNVKYRGPGKKFWQRKDGRKTFFNADVLSDPALREGRFPLVITEGEIDALSFMQAGYPFVVSVPDGAPPPRDQFGKLIPVPDGADDIDVEHDEKFRYIANNWEYLAQVKRIVLAVDGDEPGWRLAQELARRLGKARCSFVAYPDRKSVPVGDGTFRAAKDANEVLVYVGMAEVNELVTKARPFPVRGLYKLSEFPDEGPITTYSVGFPGLEFRQQQPKEPHLLLYRGAFGVVSGLPGSGKTAWLMQLAANMALIHGWRTAIASFEMRVTPTLRDMLRGFFIKRPRRIWTPKLVKDADDWIQDMFSFIALQPHDDETEADMQWVVDRAADAVVRDGVDMLTIDPWNEVEHKHRPGESSADYTNRAIRTLKRFASNYDVATLVAAHPTKHAALAAQAGGSASLYDIDHGAAWVNKAELGVMIHRKSTKDTVTEIGIRKVKFRGTGRTGECYLSYDEDLEQFVA
jgi:twinkle protein